MKIRIVISILILIALVFGVSIWRKTHPISSSGDENPMPTNSVSDSVIKFSNPVDFGLAVTKDQVLVSSYIPPCSEGFDYCLYYNGNEFENTNFESAGIRIDKRPDLTLEEVCLNTAPDGFGDKAPSGKITTTSYSSSVFSGIGDAGAGHYAKGELYRIYTGGTCYEIETRIGESQFANYPAGTITEFSEADRDKVYAKFKVFFNNLILESTGSVIKLPESED